VTQRIDHPCLRAAALAALLLLGGCAELNSQLNSVFGPKEASRPRPHPRAEDVQRARAERSERPAPKPERPAANRDDTALREGIALYHEGEFNAAIKRLTSSDMNGGSLRNRITALKYTAFSYCVTGRPVPCRQAFERALRLDPNFDLAPGEQGHPQWGPVFAKVKQGAR
jgi:hypothetical protein